MEDIIIRKIRKADNNIIAEIIKAVLTEFGGDKPGTAYNDYDTNYMFEAYKGEKEVYYVAEHSGKVVGGSGIKTLSGNNDKICELQKLYINPEIRGLGIGKSLVEKCLDFAIKSGFKQCYLETFPNMLAAIQLYKKFNFRNINAPIGDTGHNGCDVWMLKNL